MTRILCPVLVGREAERGRLEALLESARRGRGSVVFLCGPAGMGKSRLAAEVAGRAAALRMPVLQGRSVPSRVPVPYRPIAEALVAASPDAPVAAPGTGSGFEAALATIVPAWQGEATTAAAASPVVIAEALLRALRNLAPEAGCLLVLDDLQWADPETLHAVEHLADHTAGSSVLCIATLRDEPGAEAMDLLARLDARRAAEVVRLQPLAIEAVTEMALRSLGAAGLPQEVTAFLGDHAEGTPFLVEELLAAAVADGALVDTAQGWTVAAAIPRVVPQSFAATVRERLATLGDAGRRFLAAAALQGRSFDWRLAARAAEMDGTEARTWLDRAAGLQLLAAHAGGFRFRHALTRDALLDQLLPAERATLAARCLEGLESAAPAGEDWRHLAADLAELAGEPDRAAEHLLAAGRDALSRGALDSAVAALQRAAVLAADPARRAAVLDALAESRSTTGDLPRTREAVESLLAALAEIGAPPGPRAQAHLLLARCAVNAAQFTSGSEELAQARRLATAAGDSALAARITAVDAHLAIGEGRLDEAEALATRAAEEAGATGQPEVACEALEVASRCARTRDAGEAEAIATRALQVAEDAGLAFWRMRALYQLGVARMFRDGEVETLRRAQDAAGRLGAVATATSLDLEISAGLEAQHRLEEARATALRCAEMAHRLQLRMVEALAHAFVAVIEAAGGARSPMEAAIARSLELGDGNAELVAALWGDARAVASLAAEDRARARAELAHAVSLYGPALPAVPHLSAALLTLVVAVDGGEPDFAATSGVTQVNSQGGGYVEFARAVMLGRAGRAAEACAAAARGEQRLNAMPWYRHLCRRLAAEAAMRDGWGDPTAWLTEAAAYFDADGSDRLATACRSLLRRAGVRVARPTQAGRALPQHLRDAGVTPREAEVLTLVGEGLPNRAIAERLALSERTVEQHVGWLKQKLGMETRAQLAVYAASGPSLRRA